MEEMMKYKDHEKPFDMAEEAVLRPDGVNPVARDDERPKQDGSFENGFDIHFPGAIPPAYFPGYPGYPPLK